MGGTARRGAGVVLAVVGLGLIGACSDDEDAPSATMSSPDGGGGAADGAAPADSGIPGVAIDPGRSVTAPIKAAAGGSIALPDGARIDIPAGALPSDMTITVTVPTKQTADATSFTYVIDPPGTRLLAPATLTIPITHFPAEADLLQAFLSSKVNPTVDVGGERTNWVPAEMTAQDPVARTMSFALPDFTVFFATIAVDAEHRTYLVTDIPAAYLHRGDLLFTLTSLGPGPSWQPGHVAGFVGSFGTDAPEDRIVEANGAAVVESTLKELQTEGGHIYLGPRRPKTPLAPDQEDGAASFLLAQVGKGYSLIGEQSLVGDPGAGTSFSCVGLCEASLQSVGSGTLDFFDRLTIATPLEQFDQSEPVTDLWVCPGDDVKIPIYGVVIDHRSPFLGCTFRGYYSVNEPTEITTGPLPDNATMTGAVVNGISSHVFEWTPSNEQAGQLFELALHMKTSRVKCTTGLFDEKVDRTLNLHVGARVLGEPVPAIASMSATSGKVGDVVTITGTSFDPKKVVVRFNGVVAPVSSVTPTSIVVTVPPNARTGPVTVANRCNYLTATPKFTVDPSQVFHTSYTVQLSNTVTIPNTCRSTSFLATGSPLPGTTFLLVTSDGGFYYESFGSDRGTSSPAGAFTIDSKAGGLVVHSAGTLGDDGALSFSRVASVDDPSVFPPCAKGATETYKTIFTPQETAYPALLTAAYSNRCPTATDGANAFLVFVDKMVSTNALQIQPKEGAYDNLFTSGTLESGGSFHATGDGDAVLHKGWSMTVDGTLAEDGTGSGTFTVTRTDGCNDAAAFVLKPLAPVKLGIP